MKRYIKIFVIHYMACFAVVPTTALFWLSQFGAFNFTFENVLGSILIGGLIGFLPTVIVASIVTWLIALKEAK